MTARPPILVEMAALVAARIHAAMPELAECRAISGRLDLEEIKAISVRTPAVLVSRLGAAQGQALAGPHQVFRARMVAFVLTKDTLGLDRDAAASGIAQALCQLLPEARFGRGDLGPAEQIAEEPLVTASTRKAGLALTAVTWAQDIALAPLPEGVIVQPRVYVGGVELTPGGAA